MLKALRGTKDILPADIGIWEYIEDNARDIFSVYGYKEIRTPIIEEAALFIRSIGDATDIVEKQMYIFSDRGRRPIALRPEATASIVRSYIENSLGGQEALVKVFYIGPMFRSERPQKGRQRQFHQLGVEAIGSDNPYLDIEIISLAVRFLEKIGVKDFKLKMNSLGCQKDKFDMIEKTRKKMKVYLDSLCSECKIRYKKNVLRVFDCKKERCKGIAEKIKLENLLCKDCSAHFDSIKKGLERLGIDYIVDPKIVRGIDYYTKTVFEIIQKDLGAKDAVCAGGRYNNLIQEMGGEATPAVGFAFGIERLILTLKGQILQPKPLDVFVATINQSLYEDAFALMDLLRRKGLWCEIDYEKRSLKAQMRKAEKLQARYVIIFGEEEFRKNKVVIRDMNKRMQRVVNLENILEEFTK